MEVKIEFVHCYFTCDNFKYREAEKLNRVISGLSSGSELKFNAFGNIRFDEEDTKNAYPIISWEEGNAEWSRKNANCLVYDMMPSYRNNSEYDKLFIYQTIRGNNVVWYGWVAYNTQTGKYSHKSFIEPTYMDLFTSFNIFLNSIEKYKKYTKRLKSLRGSTPVNKKKYSLYV